LERECAVPVIVVADDDPALREIVAFALEREGWTVVHAADGQAALRCAERSPDLVVLDVGMPELDGLEVCRRLRAAGNRVPILFLSTRSEEIDRVVGLELGGDDYLAKPFSPRELVSRAKAILRRVQARPTAEIAAAGIRIRPEEHRAWVGEAPLDLTATELRLLVALCEKPGKVLGRDELVRRAYGGPHHVAARTLDSHVRNLRAKLRELGVDPIETVHGVGFRLS
jgi:two-component system, OmpR family, response regulator